MAENLPELAWIANPKGRLIWGNRRWREYTGASPDQIGNTDWRSLHDPAFLPHVTERWVKALASGEPVEMTFPLKGANGAYRMFLTRAEPLRNGAGAITCWFGVNTDVGALQAATAALADQTRLLETLNRTAAKVAAELNLEQLVQMVVDAAVDLTGAQFGAFFYNVPKDAGEAYTLYSISGVARENFSKFPMPRATEVFQPTFHGTGVVRSPDITKDPRYGKNAPYKGMPEGHLPVRSYLAAPVVSRQGEVMGGLFFGHPDAGRFTEHHEQLLAGLAAQAAIGIDNSRLYDKAQREIAERRQAEEDRLVILRELNHRVKNLFAVATGMVGMTARTSASTAEMAETLTGRLRALARAHELIRSTISSPSQQARHTTLRVLVDSVLEAHATPGGEQLRIAGPEIPVGPGGATSLALVLHELATNAAKYGALSEPTGSVSVSWRADDSKLILTWAERGGPTVSGPPSRKGFGAELARMSARGQLGGDIEYSWKHGGVEIVLRASLERLAI